MGTSAQYDAPAPPSQEANGSTRPRAGTLIGDVIVEQGFAARGAVEAAAVASRQESQPIGQLLVAQGQITPQQLGQAIALRFGVQYVDVLGVKVDPAVASMVDGAVARRLEALPLGFAEDGHLVVAIANPANMLAIDDLAMMTGRQIRPVVAAREDILLAITGQSSLEGAVAAAVEEETPAGAVERVELRASATEAPTVKLVRSIISRGVEQRASDIHLDPESFGLQVRFRIDGVMVDAARVPVAMTRAVISHIKILANLDIAERRLAQDGRIDLAIEGRKIDLRVVVLPLVDGESVVLRILDSGTVPLTLEDLGMQPHDRDVFSEVLRRRHGGVLACGPTGAGKSSTLYAALLSIASRDTTIVTIEDPVEYRLDGIRQVQVNEKAGMTFATGLRSMVRADPDVMMVGEIRDTESAKIAVEAALTGHLVLSTLHTNDASSAVGRLIDMGIEPFLVASAIDCIVAQRLARRLCEHCRKPGDARYPGTFEAEGCARCGGTGYHGRIALFEVMTVTSELHQLIVDRGSKDAMTELARSQGMRRLREDGMDKVRAGLTSLAEVARVTGTT